MARYLAHIGDESFTVEIHDGKAKVAGSEPLAVERAAPGEVTLARGGRRHTAFVVADGDRRAVFVGGEVFEIELSTAARRHAPARHHHESLGAPMPATVVKVVADRGTAVKRGDTVLILEAMKMELPVRAPRDGVVEAVHCRAGDLVQPGVPLVDLDESHDA
jgi:biotin carboxyl carrier protein